VPKWAALALEKIRQKIELDKDFKRRAEKLQKKFAFSMDRLLTNS
jgi:hypothetical protein